MVAARCHVDDSLGDHDSTGADDEEGEEGGNSGPEDVKDTHVTIRWRAMLAVITTVADPTAPWLLAVPAVSGSLETPTFVVLLYRTGKD